MNDLSFSLAALITAGTTLVTVVSAWVTLRITVKHHAEKLTELRRQLEAEIQDRKQAQEKISGEFDIEWDKQDKRLDKLEKWRERARGAAASSSSRDTDRILLTTSETGSGMHRAADE